jgi:hypothetical protein
MLEPQQLPVQLREQLLVPPLAQELGPEQPLARACRCRRWRMGYRRLVEEEVGVGSRCTFRKCHSLKISIRDVLALSLKEGLQRGSYWDICRSQLVLPPARELPQPHACKCHRLHMGCTTLEVVEEVDSWCIFHKCRSLHFVRGLL